MTPRIDSHQHFWRPARGDYGWLRADVPALARICRDILPADFKPLRLAHGINASVLVQAAPSVAETDFLLSLADADPSIVAVVGWCDLADPGSVALLQRWARHPAFKGVRPMLQDLPEHDWIADAPHPAVVQALVDLGLRFDALVQPWHLAALLSFVQRWPGLPVVIDHAAKPQLARGWQADGETAWAAAWRDGLAALARQPQVCCKLSGLLTEAAGAARHDADAAAEAVLPVWQHLLAQFGAERLMWGSDWPVLELAAPYETWVQVSERLIGTLPGPDQAALWAGNAARFYAIQMPPSSKSACG